jgi:diadenosine tetraphosphate (Ap4A) HIT family hydrolase
MATGFRWKSPELQCAMPSDPRAAGWTLDPQLERDTTAIGDMALCRVLLSRDANYPWLLLVPRRRGTVEIIDLRASEQTQLMTEIADVSLALKTVTSCDKLNVAAIGNVVAQLHVHVVARTRGDAAWPKPVWNAAAPRDYEAAARERLTAALRQRLELMAI